MKIKIKVTNEQEEKLLEKIIEAIKNN